MQTKELFYLHRWTFLSFLVLFLGAGWIWFSRTQPGSTTIGGIPAPRSGFQAPEFILESTTGELISLADQRDKVILINFWTSWCPPCRGEMPAIQKIYQDYQDDGLIVLGINAANQDNTSDALAFIKENQLTFPILFDQDGQISRQYDLRSLPTSFFIGKNGMIQEVVIGGPMAEALLRIRVERLLQQGK